jgi:hypothetical protein
MEAGTLAEGRRRYLRHADDGYDEGCINRSVKFVRCGLVAVVLTLASACGGGGGEDGPLSASEFRDRAEAICREVEEATGDIDQPSDLNDVGRFVEEMTAAIDKAVADNQALQPPKEFQARWQEYLRLTSDFAARVHKLGDDIQGASAAEIVRLVGEFETANRLYETRPREIEGELGLDECVN